MIFLKTNKVNKKKRNKYQIIQKKKLNEQKMKTMKLQNNR